MPMNSNQTGRPELPLKVLASLFVAWHFFAIFCAVTATSTSIVHPAPLPAVQLARSNYWYREALFFNNAYRFYVPDPGPVQTMWFRLEYEGPRGRSIAYWYEVPRRDQFSTRMAYQRHLSVTMLLQMQGFDPTRPEQLHPLSEVMQASYIRHVAHQFPRHPNANEAKELKQIDVYHVGRTAYPTGYQIQRGLYLDDPRWYRPVFYASYKPDGSKLELSPAKRILRETLPQLVQGLLAQGQDQPTYSDLFPVTAEFLLYDYHPLVYEMGYESKTALELVNPPAPMARLLREVPEVFEVFDRQPVVSPKVYGDLIYEMHRYMQVRRPVRLLEEDLPPLGFRPPPQKPTGPTGADRPPTVPSNPGRPAIGN
jgi:hypothetical protein